ncbi:MAG: SoxR reducing system RseC family protein [Alphaproteobacteria bacterium]|nr:SoxR reducing system RseC family protein [Alphaproteobacteria bacterium]
MQTITGIVINNQDGYLNIQVDNTSCEACQSCDLRRHCHPDKASLREMKLPVDDSAAFAIGSRLKVSLSDASLLKAALIGYLIPLAAMLAAVILMHLLGFADYISGICGIIVLILCYYVISSCRDILGCSVEYDIKKM